MTTRAETVARLMNQAGAHLKNGIAQPMANGCIDAAMRCLHLAFLETLGGAECASPAPAAEGPWVVRLPLAEAERAEKEGPLRTSYPHGAVVAPQPDDADHSAAPWGYANTDSPDVWRHANSRDEAIREGRAKWPSEVFYVVEGTPHTTDEFLPSADGIVEDMGNRAADNSSAAEDWPDVSDAGLLALDGMLADWAEKHVAAPLFWQALTTPERIEPDDAEDISATLRREECERKAARQATPAGWVVRHIGGPLRWLCRGPRGYEPYATREDAQHIADTTGGEPVPVDAAGNVIEPAGVAWEASRSYEEAERLRAELATWKRTAEQRMERIRSVKAERDDRSARCDAAETDVARLTKERDTARAERDTAKAERDKLTTDEADLRYALRHIAGLVGGAIALGASTEMHCAVADEVRLVVERLKREEALAREGERIAVAERDRLAPVVRDHSEVIAQCEEALRRCSLRGKDDALLAALAALRGAP